MRHGQETDRTLSTYEYLNASHTPMCPSTNERSWTLRQGSAFVLVMGLKSKDIDGYDVETGRVLHSHDLIFDESSRLKISGEQQGNLQY